MQVSSCRHLPPALTCKTPAESGVCADYASESCNTNIFVPLITNTNNIIRLWAPFEQRLKARASCNVRYCFGWSSGECSGYCECRSDYRGDVCVAIYWFDWTMYLIIVCIAILCWNSTVRSTGVLLEKLVTAFELLIPNISEIGIRISNVKMMTCSDIRIRSKSFINFQMWVKKI